MMAIALIIIFIVFVIIIGTALLLMGRPLKFESASQVSPKAKKLVGDQAIRNVEMRKNIFGKIGGYIVTLKANGSKYALDSAGERYDLNNVFEVAPYTMLNSDPRPQRVRFWLRVQFPIAKRLANH